jgi:hypothetical protein
MKYSYADLAQLDIVLSMTSFELEFVREILVEKMENDPDSSKSWAMKKLVREIDEVLERFATSISYDVEYMKKQSEK